VVEYDDIYGHVWLPWSAYEQTEHCMTYLRTVLTTVISMFTLNNPNNCT